MGLVAGAIGGFLYAGIRDWVRGGGGLSACGGVALGGGKAKKGLMGNGKAKRQVGKDVKKSQYGICLVKIKRQNIDIM